MVERCGRDRSAEANPNHNTALGPGYVGKSGGALWAFAGCLLLSSLLVVALPAKVVNR